MSLDCVESPVEAPSSALFAAALRGEPCTVHGLAGEPRSVPMARWADEADESDQALLARCQGPTLDIGCGPGRMTHALAARGTSALGIDVIPEAVAQARARGGSAILRDVFSPVPGEGRWETALLADGNIGIGGDPVRLLRRVGMLLGARGRVVVDLAPPGLGLRVRRLRLEVGSRRSEPFVWSVVAPEVLPAVAAQTGLEVSEVAEHRSRWFAVLRKQVRGA